MKTETLTFLGYVYLHCPEVIEKYVNDYHEGNEEQFKTKMKQELQ